MKGLKEAIAKALDPFIREEHLIPGTKQAVIDMVTEQATMSILLMCGDPDAPKPKGLLGYSPLERRCTKPSPSPYACDKQAGHKGPCGQERPGRKGVVW